MEAKAKRDLIVFKNFIYNHENKDDFVSMFLKGPDPEKGFMWTGKDWWTEEEAIAVKLIGNKVLDYDWDSSGYGMMMRMVQDMVKRLSFKQNCGRAGEG
tara:strand:- start:86 stop:382 length:297 start_codon:yes stop_codon:yes gene_type:complete